MSGILGTNGVFESLSTEITVGETVSNYLNINIGRALNYIFGTFYSSPGNIFIVRIYNRRLSQEEMLQNYNATKTRFGL
jgi:small basic protein